MRAPPRTYAKAVLYAVLSWVGGDLVAAGQWCEYRAEQMYERRHGPTLEGEIMRAMRRADDKEKQ